VTTQNVTLTTPRWDHVDVSLPDDACCQDKPLFPWFFRGPMTIHSRRGTRRNPEVLALAIVYALLVGVLAQQGDRAAAVSQSNCWCLSTEPWRR